VFGAVVNAGRSAWQKQMLRVFKDSLIDFILFCSQDAVDLRTRRSGISVD